MLLPSDARVVLSGHQADLWHGGILAKHFASLAFASRIGAHAAWIVVDQDEANALGMRIPVRDATGRLRETRWEWGEGAGRVVSALGPIAVRELALKPGDSFANASIEEGTRSVAGALMKHANEASWARQVSAAGADLIARSAPPPRFMYESRLASTDLFQQVLDGFVRGGADVILGYNQAIASAPESGMRMLDQAKGELPLWDVRGGRRKRVSLSDVEKLDRTQLAPRGMLMTAILRLAGCDLFVHGMGGGVYDRATETWVASWEGELATLFKELGGELAPMAVATANLRLPLSKPGLPTDQQIQRGVWMAHHAYHDPRSLGDEQGAIEKDRLLAEIQEKKAMGQSPAGAFSKLHAVLEQSRRTGAGKLAEFADAAKRLASQRSEASIAFDRTWSFALQTPGEIGMMYERVLGEFA
jgi:hypothetical protein